MSPSDSFDEQATVNKLVHAQLDERLTAFETAMGADALALIGPMDFGMDDVTRDAVEWRIGERSQRDAQRVLAVILETTGGYIEVVERMADTFRAHYERVEFVIPNHAFSAGTILVMSGDAIHMDYYSVLGPIDPQVAQGPGGTFVPALGYLEQYNRLLEKSRKGELSTAELAILLDKFDPAEMYAYEQQQALSVTLLKRWLATYKFKDWNVTATRCVEVTTQMREDRAEEVAKKLQDTSYWHTHSRGIAMSAVREVLNLLVDDFGTNPAINKPLKAYHRLLVDFMRRTKQAAVVHVPGRYTPVPQ